MKQSVYQTCYPLILLVIYQKKRSHKLQKQTRSRRNGHDILQLAHLQKVKQNKGKSIVIPHFVGGQTWATFPITDEYAKHVLMCYKPWEGDFEKIIGEKNTWVDQYNDWLKS